MTDRVCTRTRERPILYVDSTGVGQPVVDLLRERVRSGVVVPVTFTAGDRRVESWEDGFLRVSLGKALLVSRLQVMLGSGRLHLPPTREAQVLAHELRDFELRVDQDGHEKSGAFRVGTHDDLVTALGLAVQVDDIAFRGGLSGATSNDQRF